MPGRSVNVPPAGEHWSADELDAGAFKGLRLGRRCIGLLRRLSEGMGGTIPLACQDWTNTKAAYRFFANPKVEEGDILSGHFASTRKRYAGSEGPILLLQDTTEFTISAERRMMLDLRRRSTAVGTRTAGFAITRYVEF